jgi:hypothetical protein
MGMHFRGMHLHGHAAYKNASRGHTSHGMHLTGMHLIDVYLTDLVYIYDKLPKVSDPLGKYLELTPALKLLLKLLP